MALLHRIRSTVEARRTVGERGAVLVEFAASVILLVTLSFGTVEFGLAWQDRNTVQTATRAGVRVGSNLGTTSDADYNLLLAVRSGLTDVGISNIDSVVIYNASAANGAPPDQCINPPTTSTTYSCNAYDKTQISQLGTTITASSFGCTAAATTGKLDCGWKPGTRQTLLSSASGPDYLGVWVRVKHAFITKLFGSTINLTDSAVMRLEPA